MIMIAVVKEISVMASPGDACKWYCSRSHGLQKKKQNNPAPAESECIYAGHGTSDSTICQQI